MQIVTAKTAHKEINNGVTKPYIITCDDSEQYVVKFKENPEGKRVLANEYVCAKIAEILDLPLATPSFVQVNETFIQDYGSQVSAHTETNVTPGFHFGTKKIKKHTKSQEQICLDMPRMWIVYQGLFYSIS
ncbi:HipA family kinase [Bacillus cereus]